MPIKIGFVIFDSFPPTSQQEHAGFAWQKPHPDLKRLFCLEDLIVASANDIILELLQECVTPSTTQ